MDQSKLLSQIRSGIAPLASFEDLPTDEQYSEASLIEDLPCVSECLNDQIFHDNNESFINKQKVFKRNDTSYSADMNGSLISLTPTCSITPTELESPTKSLTPVNPINSVTNNFLSHSQFRNQSHVVMNPSNPQIVTQKIIKDNNTRSEQSIEISKVPLSPPIILNDVQISDEQYEIKSSRRSSWAQFFRNRSKSAGSCTMVKSPTSSFISFFSQKQSSNQLNNVNQKKRKKGCSIFSFFSTLKKSTRGSLQNLSNQNNNLNINNLSTNLNKVISVSSPKILNDYFDDNYNEIFICKNTCPSLNHNVKFDSYVDLSQIQNEKSKDKNSAIDLEKPFNQNVKQFVVSQIELTMNEKEEFDKKIKEDIYLEEKILDADIPIKKSEKEIYIDKPKTIAKMNEFESKNLFSKRILGNSSDTLDEIRSLPARLPSFRKKIHENESSVNADYDTDDVSITDQLDPKDTNYKKKNINIVEIANLLEDEDSWNEFFYETELNFNPSQLKLQDKNERLNVKIIPVERPRSATPVNFSTFEAFINSSEHIKIEEQNKIKLKLPDDECSEFINTSGRKFGPRIASSLNWQEWERRLQTPKYNARHNLNIEDQTNQKNVEDAFKSSIDNLSTNETLNQNLDNYSPRNKFEDNFVNAYQSDSQSFLGDQKKTDKKMITTCVTTNFSTCTDKMRQESDENNNLSNDNSILDEICRNRNNEINRKQELISLSLENIENKLNYKCNCHDEEKGNSNLLLSSQQKRIRSKTHQRIHSVLFDSSALICSSENSSSSSSSSSSSNSRRVSLSDNISYEK